MVLCIVVRRISFPVFQYYQHFWEEMDQDEKNQEPGSVMGWGFVGALGKGKLYFCDGTMRF